MNRRFRYFLSALIFIESFSGFAVQAASPPGADGELREGNLDIVLLLDKSLSMASCMSEAKTYAATKVLEPTLVAGDRLIVEAVYGKIDRLLSLTIGSSADVAKAVRAIRSVKADGRFTDLGLALDAAKRDLDELGKPERPKYVLLITDERQEAPKGSPYQARDYKLIHPSLDYAKRVDLGRFRAITVGLQVKDKVAQAVPEVMELLLDPPSRLGLGAGNASGKGSANQASAQGRGGNPADAGLGGKTTAERVLPSWLLIGAMCLLVAALAGLGGLLLVSRRRGSETKTS